MSDTPAQWNDKAIADYFDRIPMPRDYAQRAYIAARMIKDGLRAELNTLRGQVDELTAARDLWHGRADGAVFALMQSHPEMTAFKMVDWIAESAQAIDMLSQANALMEANIKTQGERIMQLEKERNDQANRRYEFQEQLAVLDETRNTCSAAWGEIDSEVERINEEGRLARLEGTDE